MQSSKTVTNLHVSRFEKFLHDELITYYTLNIFSRVNGLQDHLNLMGGMSHDHSIVSVDRQNCHILIGRTVVLYSSNGHTSSGNVIRILIIVVKRIKHFGRSYE